MKSFTERDGRLIGLVVVAVAVVLVAGVLVLNRSVFTPSYVIHARFVDAAGISKGAPVTVAGVNVGSVKAVRVDGDAVMADLAINHGVVLPHQTGADIEVQTVLGVLDVALQPERGWDDPLRAGATITDTSVPVEFQDLENTTGNLLQKSDVQAFNQLLTSVAKISAGKQAEVAQIIDGLDKFTGVVDQRSSQVSSLIDAANTLSSAVAQRDSQLSSVITNLNTVVQGLAAHSSDLATLIDQTDQFASQTASLVGQNQPQLQALIKNLHAVLDVVSQHQDDLAEGVSYLASAITGFSSIGYSGPNDTPNNWGNIFENLAGVGNAYGVLGNCAALDQALDEVLGPDPMPCDQRSGPLPTSSSSSSSSASPGGSNTTTTTTQPAGGAASAATPSPSTSTTDPVQQLLHGLLEG